MQNMGQHVTLVSLVQSKAQAKQSKVAVIDGNWWSSQAKTRAAAIQPPPLVNCGLPPRM